MGELKQSMNDVQPEAGKDAGAGGANLSVFANLKYDLPAGLVVFLVALPLCLGIALASGAPLFSGLIAGLAGGLVIPLISRSSLSVSGPAAGLAAIVLVGITKLGAFEVFTLAVVLSGLMQIAFGLVRAGGIANYIPSSVIKGMLTAIGVLLILKQLPHVVGFDVEEFGAMTFAGHEENTFSRIPHALRAMEPGAALIGISGLVMLVIWDKIPALKKLTWLPGPLAVVVIATLTNLLFQQSAPAMALGQEHLVTLPAGDGPSVFFGALRMPDWSAVSRPDVWILAVTLAIVASLETLLNMEAVDRIDPWKRKSPPNTELLAQGAGNLVSGLMGGLPVTSVIVRSSANVNAGARTRAAAFFHGVFLLLAVLFASSLLTKIPLAGLAAILLVTGYKLAKPAVFVGMFRLGWGQFVPFVTTVLAIVFTDLLKGIGIGLAVGLVFVVRESMSRVFEVSHQGSRYTVRFLKDAYFFSRGKLIRTFDSMPKGAHVVVDATATHYVDHDVAEAIRLFEQSAAERGIHVEIRGLASDKPQEDAPASAPAAQVDVRSFTPARTSTS